MKQTEALDIAIDELETNLADAGSEYRNRALKAVACLRAIKKQLEKRRTKNNDIVMTH